MCVRERELERKPKDRADSTSEKSFIPLNRIWTCTSCVCMCVREIRKIELTAWGKKCPFPQRDSNLCLWDAHPSCLRLHQESRHTSRDLTQTLQTLTHQLHHETQACITKHSNCCACTRAFVCVCHYEKKIADVVLVVSSRLLCCSNPSRPCCGKGFFKLLLFSSVSASQNFHRMLHFFVASL